MNRTTMVLAAALALGGLQALAEDALPVQDADGDGVYSLVELQTVAPDMTAEAYAALDTSGDGGVDAAELAAAIAAGTFKPAG